MSQLKSCIYQNLMIFILSKLLLSRSSPFLIIQKIIIDGISEEKEVHVLINNAGLMCYPKAEKTEDGFEIQFATNHLGQCSRQNIYRYHFGCLYTTFEECEETKAALV